MKKRLISLLLAGCMTAMLSVAAFAADTTGADAKDEEASLVYSTYITMML